MRLPMLYRICVWLLALLVPALSLPNRAALAADPLLTILYTGNAEGHYAPCPS